MEIGKEERILEVVPAEIDAPPKQAPEPAPKRETERRETEKVPTPV